MSICTWEDIVPVWWLKRSQCSFFPCTGEVESNSYVTVILSINKRKKGIAENTEAVTACVLTVSTVAFTQPPVRPWNLHSVITAINGDDGVLMSILMSATSLGSQLADNYDRPQYHYNESSTVPAQSKHGTEYCWVFMLAVRQTHWEMFWLIFAFGHELQLVLSWGVIGIWRVMKNTLES